MEGEKVRVELLAALECGAALLAMKRPDRVVMQMAGHLKPNEAHTGI